MNIKIENFIIASIAKILTTGMATIFFVMMVSLFVYRTLPFSFWEIWVILLIMCLPNEVYKLIKSWVKKHSKKHK